VRFAYTYRSSDGQRHAAEIEAESRDAAFAAIRRELGVKPIKVTAAAGQERQDGGSPYGRAGVRPSPTRRLFTISFYLFAAIAALAAIAWLWARRADAPYQVMTPQGPVTYTTATPLPRQRIPGDRARIEAARETAFRSSAERLLSRYAEPGRPVAAQEGPPPTEAEFRASLREPVRIASTDFTETVDLKRIVAGMKREMGAYLAGGGTAGQYLAELEKRQRLEISYRENAGRRLAEMLAERSANMPHSGKHRPDGRSTTGQGSNHLRAAYAYWLKANAQLQSMGIWEIPLPDELRAYQMSIDIDE